MDVQTSINHTVLAIPEKRRSRAVPLLLAGTLGLSLTGCSGTDMQRNRYASFEDCVRDYSPAQCQNNGGSGSGSYHGPWYRSRESARGADGDPGAGRSYGSRLDAGHGPSGVELGTRGGFGSSGRIAARGS
jgi:hypothetical protein